jgi:hypothetical protein
VGEYGKGVSCTNKPSSHGPFKLKCGLEILLIDTVGFRDTDPNKLDSDVADNLT